MTVDNLHDAIGQLPSDLIAAADEKRSRKRTVIPLRRYAAIAACLVLVLGSSYLVSRIASGGAKETAMAAPEMMQAADESNRFDAPAAAAPKYEETGTEAPAAIGEPEAPAEEQAVCGYPTIETYEAEEIPPEEPVEDISADNTMLQFDSPIDIQATQYAGTRNTGTINTTSEPVIRILRSQADLEAFREHFGYYDLEAFHACCDRFDESWFELHDLLVVLMKSLPEDSVTKVTSMLDVDDNGIWELCISYSIPYEDTAKRADRFILMEAKKDAIADEKAIVIILE